MSSIFAKSSYARILFVGLPFGIGCLIVGITQFGKIPDTDEKLQKHFGIIKSLGDTTYYIPKDDMTIKLYHIRINDTLFYADRTKKQNNIKAANLVVGDSIMIWTDLDDNIIEQLTLNNEMVMPYKPPYWLAWGFTLFGVFMTIGSIKVLIQDRKDFW